MTSKQDIDIKKIQMTWDYITKDVDIHCRILLQYFAVLLTFIVGVMLAVITGNLNFFISIPILFILLVIVLFDVRKIRSYSRKAKGVLDELLNELDKLK